MKRLSRTLQRLWDARYWIPVTPLGLAVVLVSWWVYQQYGHKEQDFVLYAASLFALLLVGLAAAMVLITTGIFWLLLRRDHQEGALNLQSNTRAVTGYHYARLSSWPLVQVQLHWASPTDVNVDVESGKVLDRADGQQSTHSRQKRRMHEVVYPRSRGRYPYLRRRFVIGDIFGLCRFGLVQNSNHPLRIEPAKTDVDGTVLTHLSAGDALSHPSGPADGELLDMRRYAHGDPLRRVLWKAFARTRQLLVRTPERAIAPNPSAVGYMVAGENDEATASAARFFVESGLLGKDFLFGADGGNEAAKTAGEAVELIIGSASYRRQGAKGLPKFIDEVGEHRRQSTILFLPPSPGPWLANVEAMARRLPGATAVIAMDGSLEGRYRGKIRRIFFTENRKKSIAPQASGVVKRLANAGYTMRIIHRPSGRMISTQQLAEMATL